MKRPLLTRFLLLFLSLSACDSNETRQIKERPNILIIYVDDLGYGDLSTYGGDIPSPNIQKIADTGIKFTDFYVSAPVCSPSRYSLLTGSYPQRSKHGIFTALMPGDSNRIDAQEKLLPHYLKEAGYETALFGKWHLGSKNKKDFPTNHGFDHFIGHLDGCIDYFEHGYAALRDAWYKNTEPFKEEGFSTDLITNHALDFLKNREKESKPYFMYLAYNAPHFGKTDPTMPLSDSTLVLKETIFKDMPIANTLQVPTEYLARFNEEKDPYRQMYSAMVANLDDNVGRMLNQLNEDGSLENTLIWFISDNGGYSETYFGHASNGALRGEKAQLFEGGIRIPALVSWPRHIKAGQVINQPACNVDVLPTLVSIAGIGNGINKNTVDGIDISEVLFENKTLERDIYWKYDRSDQYALRTGDWKLLNDELYNLSEDLGEQNNLAEERTAKYEELKLKWIQIDKSFGR
mgnify:CR=1 FL=1